MAGKERKKADKGSGEMPLSFWIVFLTLTGLCGYGMYVLYIIGPK